MINSSPFLSKYCQTCICVRFTEYIFFLEKKTNIFLIVYIKRRWKNTIYVICLLRNRATLERNIHVKSRKAEWAECLKRDTIIMIITILTKHFITVFHLRRHTRKKQKSFLFFFGSLHDIEFIYLTLPYWANDRMLAEKPWKKLVFCIMCNTLRVQYDWFYQFLLLYV